MDYGHKDKKKKSKKRPKQDNMSQMMMMMNMMAGMNNEEEKDPLEDQLMEMIERQNALLENLTKSKSNNKSADRMLLDKIHKLEMKLEEAEENDARNPVMDLFFLQNMMLAQNSVQSQFDPEKDGKSKNMQSFLMAQMLSQMNSQKAAESQKRVVFVLWKGNDDESKNEENG